jgi:predicted permease
LKGVAMEWLRQIRRRLAVLLRRRRFDRDLEEEMQSHLEMQAEQDRQAGMDAGEAHYAARRQFGNVPFLKERSREIWGWPLLERLGQDLRYAVRVWKRNPGFTAVAVLSLALGIGANTAIFSLMDALLLRTLPVHKPKQLVVFGDNQGYSYQAYEVFRDANQWFSGIFATGGGIPTNIDIGGEQERARVELITGSYFPVLGVPAALGRTLAPEDDRVPGGHPVVVLSHAYWDLRLDRDPQIAGRVIRINRSPFTVIGVATPGFSGLVVDRSTDMWVPVAMQREVLPDSDWLTRRPGSEHSSLEIFARLKPGVSPQQAQPPVSALWIRQQTETFGMTPWLARRLAERPLKLLSASRGVSYFRRAYTLPLQVLMAITGLVLLIACANLANLLLARGNARRRELGVRISLGAGRGRLIRQMLTEAALLSVTGALLGLLVAHWGIPILLRLASNGPDPIPLKAGLDSRALAFAGFITMATTLLFGLWPALRTTQMDVYSSLKQAGGVAGPDRFHAGPWMTLVEVALSIVLLVGAGLFVHTLGNLRRLDLGLRLERLVQLEIDPFATGKAYLRFSSQLLERIRALPGVESATLSATGIFARSDLRTSFNVPGFVPQHPEGVTANYDLVGPGFLSTLGIRLVAGRDFGPQDSEAAPKAVIVNEAIARFYFGGSNPIGRKVRIQGSDWEIVGVVRDVRDYALRQAPRRLFYIPMLQAGERGIGFLRLARFIVRTSADPESVMSLLRQAVRAESPSVAIRSLNSLPVLIDRQLCVERTIATLSGYFALLAVLLVAIGVHGVISQQIVRRTKEIGIRIALGALRQRVVWEITRGSLGAVVVGMLLGLGAAAALSSLVASLLFEVKPMDFLSMAGAVMALVFAALPAALIPALRAARLDPARTLRDE